ncbi:DUF116 domain-containing protein [Methanobrevibacter curvatus]|uniref:DUF116 domain-containing protein n=1 Tax=Methanobrevibacter curvatus TaxID=49547 RepID=A0A166DXK6_9EURY|nr:DUF116 domain-containing protein [Methanobrevibacter curvatus]KZX16059.1 hypothetical protein MBCUR_01270 [Methanobrevibacter curvatus]
MFHQYFFEIIGQIAFIIVISLFVLLILALVLGVVLVKKKILIFPKIVIFALDFLYSPLKYLTKTLGFNEVMVDQIGVEIRNKINENNFKEKDNKNKIIVFPHCLRHENCPAKLGEMGLKCSECGLCSIGEIKPKAEEIGYNIFIVPGSTFIKKIVKNHKFESVLGIACYEDLNISMMNLSNFSPQGVLLSRTGCFKTDVDVQTVLEKIGYEKKIGNISKNQNMTLNNEISVCQNEKDSKYL